MRDYIIELLLYLLLLWPLDDGCTRFGGTSCSECSGAVERAVFASLM